MSNGAYAQGSLELKEVEGWFELEKFGKIREDSSLERELFVINDIDCPVQLIDSGIYVKYESGSKYSSAGYRAYPLGNLTCSIPVAAYEIRIMLFDVWNEHLVTLSGDRIRDYEPGEEFPFASGSYWKGTIYDVEDHLTVFTFVSKVRTMEGQFWSFDEEGVVNLVYSVLGKEIPIDSLSPPGEK